MLTLHSRDNEDSIIITEKHDETNFHIGLLLALTSSFFIGSSFVIKKRALIQISTSGSLRASAGGFGYLKEWTWWTGFSLMGMGEVANFTAYAFAPASLITPLGALSVVVTSILASKCLNENLNVIGKLGCILCLLGSTVVIIHCPKTEEVESLNDLLIKLQDSSFTLYVFIVCLLSSLIVFYYGPKYGGQNVLIYITLCSAIGSLSVMSCKCLGLALKEVNREDDDLRTSLICVFFVVVLVCVCIQMNYLNKALDLFNISIVIPIYYVLFTTMVIIASAILFEEWQNLKTIDIVGSFVGFFVIVIAILLLHGFKDFEITFNEVHSILSSKQDFLVKHVTTGGGSYSFVRSI